MHNLIDWHGICMLYTLTMMVTTEAMNAASLRPLQHVMRPIVLGPFVKKHQRQSCRTAHHVSTQDVNPNKQHEETKSRQKNIEKTNTSVSLCEHIAKHTMNYIRSCTVKGAVLGGILGGGAQRYGGLEWLDHSDIPWWLLQAEAGPEMLFGGFCGGVYGNIYGLGTLPLIYMCHTYQKTPPTTNTMQ